MRTSWITMSMAMAGALAPAAPALACGGFFCSSAPVDQAGEEVIYSLERDGSLTMTVRVEYAGLDEDFAWILPVPVPPASIGVGTEAIFDALRQTTQPMFLLRDRTEGTCREHPMCVYAGGGAAYTGGCGFGAASPYAGPYVDAGAGSYADAAAASDAAPPDPGVVVYSESTVGPYDTVVLGASTAAEVIEWLNDHAYDVPVESLPLLEPYAAQGQVFVALRLSANRRNGTLRPIVLRMPTVEACLPIRLTAIASVPELPITAYFLGRARVRPHNFSAAEIEITRDFWTVGRTWETAVRERVQALSGRAFATDYAGATPALRFGLPSVEDLAAETNATAFLQELSTRGYPRDALMLEVLTRFLAPPPSMAARDYINCLFMASCAAPAVFDSAGLAAAIDAEIRQPRADAEAMLFRHGYLTRLSTFMRVEDMTIDPVFVEDEGLEDVSNVHFAEQLRRCDEQHYLEGAPTTLVTPDGYRRQLFAGTQADDDAYCRSFGAYVAGTEPRARATGCLCRAGGPSSWQGGLVLLALAGLALRRWRRHRSARQA
ncbi:MAG: DUF2330 domain-containing protein [Sandaracinaceae bacterium]|nr:DUF2330 domain-containing protein [Sandaracinaceae bacterium]